MHHRGREQLVPAVLRPGRQKRPCGAFLERGRVPGEVPGQQRATGVEPCGNAGLFFCCSIPERCEQKVHHRGREQLVPAVLRPGRQKRPCGAFLERGRVPGEAPGQQRATGVEPCGNAGLFFCCSIPERCEQKVHHRGREQLVPAVLRPGRQKRPCGAFLERGRVPGEAPGQQRATGVEPYGVSRHGGLLLVCTLGGLEQLRRRPPCCTVNDPPQNTRPPPRRHAACLHGGGVVGENRLQLPRRRLKSA